MIYLRHAALAFSISLFGFLVLMPMTGDARISLLLTGMFVFPFSVFGTFNGLPGLTVGHQLGCLSLLQLVCAFVGCVLMGPVLNLSILYLILIPVVSAIVVPTLIFLSFAHYILPIYRKRHPDAAADIWSIQTTDI